MQIWYIPFETTGCPDDSVRTQGKGLLHPASLLIVGRQILGMSKLLLSAVECICEVIIRLRPTKY